MVDLLDLGIEEHDAVDGWNGFEWEKKTETRGELSRSPSSRALSNDISNLTNIPSARYTQRSRQYDPLPSFLIGHFY
jgi:hypothetical protein